MTFTIKKILVKTVIVAFFLQMTACGTILYPERKGQSSGRLDVGVVALNAVGLLVFLVPGVIAFAVDFNNGTIYLPGGSASLDGDEIDTIVVEGPITNEKIEAAILEKTGKKVSVNDSNIKSTHSANFDSVLKNEVKYL